MRKQIKNNKQKKTQRLGRSRVIPAPSASGSLLSPSRFTMNTISDGVVRFRGHELLGSVGTATFSTIAAVFDLNPACWTNSRLSKIAMTYEKYRYDSFTIRYHPTVSTTAPNGLATYVELEIDESAQTTVTGALNHQFAALGPAWAPHQLTYRRPKEDPKAYILSDKSVANRNDMSQGKVISVSSADGPQVFGYLSIEYDVVFMYPELEYGYGGEQYIQTSATIPVLAPGANITTTPTWTSTNIKVAELTLGDVLPNCVNAAGSTFNFSLGDVLYTAWDGVTWLLYENLEQALATVNPLRTSTGLAGTTLRYFLRKLTRG